MKMVEEQKRKKMSKTARNPATHDVTTVRMHIFLGAATKQRTHPRVNTSGYVHTMLYSSFLLAAASAASFAFFARLPTMRALQRS
jgi:hypothetical protein